MNDDERVTVLTATGCMQCRLTVRALEQADIPHETVDITNRADIADDLRELGFQRLPVVRAPGHAAWSGFRPDKIAVLSTVS